MPEERRSPSAGSTPSSRDALLSALPWVGHVAHPFPTSLAELISPNTYQVLHQPCLEEREGGKEGETDRQREDADHVAQW